MFIHRWNEIRLTCLYSQPLPSFGQFTFPVPRRIGGWVGWLYELCHIVVKNCGPFTCYRDKWILRVDRFEIFVRPVAFHCARRITCQTSFFHHLSVSRLRTVRMSTSFSTVFQIYFSRHFLRECRLVSFFKFFSATYSKKERLEVKLRYTFSVTRLTGLKEWMDCYFKNCEVSYLFAVSLACTLCVPSSLSRRLVYRMQVTRSCRTTCLQ